MASYTTNYNLKKPASSDTVDVADINGNMDTIDTELAKKLDAKAYTDGTKFYAVNSSGQVMYYGTNGATTGQATVALRDSSARLYVGTPTADGHASTKKYVDDADAGKVDKVTTSSNYWRVYAIGTDGSQMVLKFNTTPTYDDVPIYGSNGVLPIGTPTANNHATTKKYVDDGLANKMDDFILSGYAYSAGVQELKFMTVDYSDTDSENGVLIKFGLVSGHGNGTAYSFLEDLIVRVKPDGTVNVDTYRYFAEKIWAQGDYYGVRFYGDIFWTQDTTNKVVVFYALIGQYSSFMMTPYRRLNLSTKGTITQHTGYATAYSSGTKVWGNVDNFSAISDKVDKTSTAYKIYATNSSGAQTTLGYSTGVTAGVMVMRQSDGGVAVPQTPSANTDAASKKYVDDSISTAISSVLVYKGTASTLADLPTTGRTAGDVYNVETAGTATLDNVTITVNAGDNVAFNGTSWDVLAGIVDLSGKLDVYTVASGNYAYTAGASGREMILVGQSAVAYTLARRGANGVLKVATPSDDADAATKKYVDDAIAGAGGGVSITTYGGM